jgi:two-component system LytT family sensor kinase
MLVFNDIKTKTFIALLISGIFLVFVYLGAYFSGNASFSRVFIFQFTMVMLVGFCVIFTYVSIATAVIRLLNKRQIIYNNWKRWLIELLMIGVISVMVTLLMVEQIPPFIEPPVIDTLEKRFAPIFLPNFLFGIIIFAVVEVWTIFQQNRDLQLTLTKVEKEKVISQLAGLQQKINPHFLFNSLSVLSELVYENPKKADAFIREFTKVYRYVLDFNVETVVTVEKELEFLNAYLFLQKIRFGESLKIEKKIDG